MHQVLPLPHTSIFHPKYSSKYLEDELITKNSPMVSAVHQYLCYKYRHAAVKQWSKVSGTRSKTQEHRSCSSPRDVDICSCFSAMTPAHKQKHTRLEHSYLLLQQSY